MHAGTFENPGKAGALLPFGSYKGWGLSFFCELLGSSLIGASTIASKGVPKTVKRVNSMMAILIDPTVAQVIEPLFTHTTTLKICMPPIFTTQRSTQHSCIATANCIIIAPKRLKLRLSGSARKSQKRFRDTPRFKFQAVLARTQPFHHAA
jgi:hypothetical protein